MVPDCTAEEDNYQGDDDVFIVTIVAVNTDDGTVKGEPVDDPDKVEDGIARWRLLAIVRSGSPPTPGRD